jgi:uroporphyrin-III C-methyltransferase
MKAKVFLVGAGPGDPELLTIRACKVLKAAHVVLHDELVSREVLRLVSTRARIYDVGKRCGREGVTQERINALLIEYALMGMNVVRLKGGDPLIFARAGEEIEALRQAHIEVEIVPGITAALGAAASAQIPLTHRRISSTLLLLSGHHAGNPEIASWPENLPSHVTLAIYMPGYDYETTVQQLLRRGIAGDTPCAVIARATSKDEAVHLTTLRELPYAPPLATPSLLVVGEVVRLSQPLPASGNAAGMAREIAASLQNSAAPAGGEFAL